MLRARLFAPSLWIVLLSMFGCPAALHAAQTWTEVRSPHFRVLTDGSAQDGKKAALGFEQIRYLFELRFNNRDLASGPPLTVFAVQGENEMRQMQPELWADHRDGSLVDGDFVRRWEAQYAVIRMDRWEDSRGPEAVFHEYTHSVLHANAHWLPTWLDEGMAEFYENTRFQKKRIFVGAPSENPVVMNILRTAPLIPIADMMDARKQHYLYRDGIRTSLFYVESWAIVHYMTFGPGMGNGEKLQAFYTLLQNGTGQTQAFQQTFGDEKAFDDGLRKYVGLMSFKAGVLPAPPDLNQMPLKERKLPPAEAELALGEFAAATGHGAAAHKEVGQALALDPNLAEAHEALGFLAFREGADAQARAEWEAALKLDPNLPRALFAETMSAKPLPDQTPAELGATEAALEKVATLAPEFAPAQVELAKLAWKQDHMQQAYNHAQRAELLAPYRAGYRLLTAKLLLHGGHPDLAAASAEFVAKGWGGPDHDEAVDLWNQIPPAGRGAGAAPVYENPANTEVARGYLVSETCGRPGSGDGYSLDVRTLDGERHFVSHGGVAIGFADTFWWGEDHFSACHHLEGNPVVVLYRKGGALGADTLVSFEVRDPWPGSFKGMPPRPAPVAVAARADAAH